jgi:hypothetical protein
LFFGAGLCRTQEDFGGQGDAPDYPELLDALALDFIEHGWDVKHLVRTIVTSRTYRQSSAASPELMERDPDNRLLARQSHWRLPAEAVRDTALAESPSGWPERPTLSAGWLLSSLELPET